MIHFARECLQRPFAEFRTRPNRAIKGVLLQNRRPEKPLHAREELRTEDLESLGGDCSGCMRRHSWRVIAQADVRSSGRGARKWLRLRYCASERNNTPLRGRRGWARHHFATRFSRRLVRISPHHAAVGEAIHSRGGRPARHRRLCCDGRWLRCCEYRRRRGAQIR